MISRIGSKLAAAGAALTLAGAGAIAAAVPASASTFTADYSCNVPLTGTETITADGSLTATPNPGTVGSAEGFDFNIASLSLTSPLAIQSWSASADVTGTGAEASDFQVSGSGGAIPVNQAISDIDLTGSWTPTTSGTDTFQIGDISITVDLGFWGTYDVPCTPSGDQPTAETLTVS